MNTFTEWENQAIQKIIRLRIQQIDQTLYHNFDRDAEREREYLASALGKLLEV